VAIRDLDIDNAEINPRSPRADDPGQPITNRKFSVVR
jgi:hypothetical protein